LLELKSLARGARPRFRNGPEALHRSSETSALQHPRLAHQ
jgi:hypothetical protein